VVGGVINKEIAIFICESSCDPLSLGLLVGEQNSALTFVVVVGWLAKLAHFVWNSGVESASSVAGPAGE